MYSLFRAYLDMALYALTLVVALLPAGIIAHAAGGYFGKRFDIDPQLLMGVIFFAVFALEAYLFDRVRKWWLFRSLP